MNSHFSSLHHSTCIIIAAIYHEKEAREMNVLSDREVSSSYYVASVIRLNNTGRFFSHSFDWHVKITRMKTRLNSWNFHAILGKWSDREECYFEIKIVIGEFPPDFCCDAPHFMRFSQKNFQVKVCINDMKFVGKSLLYRCAISVFGENERF